ITRSTVLADNNDTFSRIVLKACGLSLDDVESISGPSHNPRLLGWLGREPVIDAAIFREWIINNGRREAFGRSAWRDCPWEYGPYTTIYNRWSKQGIWEDVFYALSGSGGVIGSTAVDPTHIKAHR